MGDITEKYDEDKTARMSIYNASTLQHNAMGKAHLHSVSSFHTDWIISIFMIVHTANNAWQLTSLLDLFLSR